MIVTDVVPVVAVALAVKVTTLVPVVGFVPKLAVTPLGSADVESDTLPVKPPLGVTVIVELPLLPCVTVKLLGEADSEKFGPDTTGKFTQLFAELENSNWIVYEVPLATYVPCWPLQISPISPLVMSYQASGGAEDSRDSYLGIRHRFRQFVAGNRRIVAERCGCAASRGATAACLHVWHYAIKNVAAPFSRLDVVP